MRPKTKKEEAKRWESVLEGLYGVGSNSWLYDAKNRLEIGSKIDLKSDGSNQNGLNNLEEFLTPFKNVWSS